MKNVFLLVLRILTVVFLFSANTVLAKDLAIYQRTDEFKGTTVYYTLPSQPKLEGGNFISMRYVYFSFMAVSPMKDSSTSYTIQVNANLQDWMFINSGESLIFKADDEIIPLKGLGSIGDRNVSSMGVDETAYYSFSLDTLKKLAAAKAIQFRVYGDKGQLTGVFTERMMQELRFFAQEAPGMIKDPAATTPATSTPPLPSVTPPPDNSTQTPASTKQ